MSRIDNARTIVKNHTLSMKPMKILIACECSGIVRDAFIKYGHDAWSCDILPTETPGPHIQDDVLKHLNDGWDMMIAHPECTYLTVTGNKWFLPKYLHRFPYRVKQREEAINFFMKLATANIDKICIENPVGIMSTRWKTPSQIIQPFNFGHPEPKRTCLWLIGLPKLKETENVVPKYRITKSGKRMPEWSHYTIPTKDRKKLRSRTFQGIADAMAEQWGRNCMSILNYTELNTK